MGIPAVLLHPRRVLPRRHAVPDDAGAVQCGLVPGGFATAAAAAVLAVRAATGADDDCIPSMRRVSWKGVSGAGARWSHGHFSSACMVLAGQLGAGELLRRSLLGVTCPQLYRSGGQVPANAASNPLIAAKLPADLRRNRRLICLCVVLSDGKGNT